MAIIISQLFAPAQLTASAATYYTAPATPTTLCVYGIRVRFTNTDSAAHAVTAYAIQSGGTAAASNCVMNAVSIAQNTYLDVNIPMLGPAGFLQAFADTLNKVTISALAGVVSS